MANWEKYAEWQFNQTVLEQLILIGIPDLKWAAANMFRE